MKDQSMSRHFTKEVDGSPSQISPSAAPRVTSDMTLAGTYVLLCDWHGRVVWKSGVGDRMVIGEEIWKHAAKKSMESLRAVLASVVALREERMIEVESDRGRSLSFLDVAADRTGNCSLRSGPANSQRTGAAHGPRKGMPPLPGTGHVDPRHC